MGEQQIDPTPAEPEVITLETDAEPEALPTTEIEVTEHNAEGGGGEIVTWQETEPSTTELQITEIPNPALVMLATDVAALQMQNNEMRAQLERIESVLQSAQPGLNLLATLADETIDRKTKRQIKRRLNL